MIIDLILDRQEGTPYEPKTFYNSCMNYGSIADEITRAMDAGTEENIKAALCAYIDEQEYNPEIKNYIHSVKWLEAENLLNPMCHSCGRCGKDCHGTMEKVWTGCIHKTPKN